MRKTDVKKIILKQLSDKVKPEVLEKNINGLVEEYIENMKFIMKNGSDARTLPTKDDIKWWFQKKISDKLIEKSIKENDMFLEVELDKIYMFDKLCKIIFKRYYDYEWKRGEILPDAIKELVELNKQYKESIDLKEKSLLERRLLNIILIGVIRFYKMEDYPYFKESEILILLKQISLFLDVIYKIEGGIIEASSIEGSIFIFDAFLKKSSLKKLTKEETTDGPK